MLLEAVDYSTPVDEIEPEPDESDAYQQASRRFAQVLDQALWFIFQARDPRLAAVQVAFATGSSVTEGQSMNHFAGKQNYSRAAISKGVKSFQRANGIKPIGGQKDEQACQTYSKTRSAQLQSR